MADKLTALITEALALAAAEPEGIPLFRARGEQGLFPSAGIAKMAAKRAIDEGFLVVVRTETKGRTTRELCAPSEKGLRYLIDHGNPRQVLEDFVRAIERREDQMAELVSTAHRMADTLACLRESAAAVLPQVHSARVNARPELTPTRISEDGAMNAPAMVERSSPARMPEIEELGEEIIERLADWSASAPAGQDCPLSDLLKALQWRDQPPTLGRFHDTLRRLVETGRIYLHPWTGPLYAIPEPACALLVGHNIAYYASLRNG